MHLLQEICSTVKFFVPMYCPPPPPFLRLLFFTTHFSVVYFNSARRCNQSKLGWSEMEERGLIKRARNYFKSELRLRIDHIWLRHRTSRKKNGSLPQDTSRQKKKNWSEIRPCKIQTWTFSLNIWNILLNTFKTFDILYLYYI